jgi:hypothetical protein
MMAPKVEVPAAPKMEAPAKVEAATKAAPAAKMMK